MQHRPEPALLSVRRLILAIFTFVIAFFTSVFFTPLGKLWIILTSTWVIFFLAMYLWYLPKFLSKLYFRLDSEHLTLYSGVFCKSVKFISLNNIQYVYIIINPFERLFGICSLIVVLPGGRAVIPGIKPETADNLVGALQAAKLN